MSLSAGTATAGTVGWHLIAATANKPQVPEARRAAPLNSSSDHDPRPVHPTYHIADIRAATDGTYQPLDIIGRCVSNLERPWLLGL
jgi:hypothetical protein